MDFSIREATTEDYGELGDLFAEGDVLHRQALPHVFREPDGPARTREYVAGLIADENVALFVAQGDGQLVGLVQIFIRETPGIPIMVARRYAVVDTLIVKEKFRRSGIGRTLMEKAHQWACDKGVNQVELNVWEFNTGAIAFYEELGYRTASRRMWRSLQ
jgi:ribosomal protein S18 acetylase RimI-like enzyme